MKKKGVLLGTAALCAGATVLFWQGYQDAFGRRGSPLMKFRHSYNHRADYYIRQRSYTETMAARRQRRYEIRNDRGQLLRGVYYPCGDTPSPHLVFIVHGYRSSQAEAAGVICQTYLDRGFDVFACDHVASGESEGHFLSFDYYESRDCLQWLHFLLQELRADLSLVLHGFSMGAATILKMSDQVPENVKFLVADSGFTTAEPILRRAMGHFYPVLHLMNRIFAGFDLRDTDVRPHLLRSRLPILFVHGSADPTVPYAMGEELYALYPGEKDCLFIPGGLHVEAAYRNLPAYQEKLDRMIEKYLS